MTFQRFDFSLNSRFLGLSLTDSRGGGNVQIRRHGFYTSDDGPELYTFLDSIYAGLIAIGVPLPPEKISCAFLSITEGTKVTAIINPQVLLRIVPKVDFKKGDVVHYDEIADIDEVRLPEYEFPKHGAIVYLFQHQWRRGLYFDFTANDPKAGCPPLGDVGALLGSLHTALAHRAWVRMDPSVISKMATAGWFPFARLSGEQVTSLYRDFEKDWDTSATIHTIASSLSPHVTAITESWAAKPAFAAHMDVLREAARLFSIGEITGASSLILPKVEGLLRHLYTGSNRKPKAHDLRNAFIGRMNASIEGYTALLPQPFVQFLEAYYYAGFDLQAGNVPPSRNSFLHGIGPDEQLRDPTFFLRLFLTLDQIYFCLSRMKESPPMSVGVEE